MLRYHRVFRRVHKSIWGAVALLILLGFLLQNVAGSAYYSLVMGFSTAVSSPPVELQAGTAGETTIYSNGTSALVNVGANTTARYPGGYNVLNGTYVSGSVPTSVRAVDSDYFVVQSAATSQTSASYNPSGYNLLGSTSLDSGSISNLTADDGVYMVFSSYSSGVDVEDYVDNNTYDEDGSADIGTHSNFTAQQYGPDLINDTLTEENTGGSDTLWLYVNADDGSRTDWTRVGTSPYLDAIDYSANFVNVTGNNNLVGDFNFTDSGKSTETIDSVTVQIYAQQSSSKDLEVFVWDGSAWISLGIQTLTTSWRWENYTATTVLNTWTKIDGAKIYLQSKSGAGTFEVDCARLKVDYTPPNYKLDLEVQWTNADYDETNEYLCIYGGSMGAENITVDAWNGSDWENLLTDLNSGWNNASVTPYLTTSNFTIRFKGGNETGDTTQDTWNIDATLLHVWTDQYTAEVEFTGTSNTEVWTQLNWTIDSAWDTTSVSVTLQLYNYSSGSYPTSGDGYISYTSSSTANTDENKNQTITTSPEDFRNASGNWKVKVKGIKSTSTQFKFKADWIEFKPTYYNEYTASTEFTFSSMTVTPPSQLNFTVVSQYDIGSVNVTIQVYNYTSSSYATSGEAYLNYISSSTPSTDETKILNITTSPEDFVSNGNLKIKVTGVKDSQSNQNTNQLKLDASQSPGPDIEDYVDNNSYDEDGITDKGTHSNFTAQQYGPDSINDTLTEQNTATTEWLNCNAFDATYDGWDTKIGSSPYVDAQDQPTNYIGETNTGGVDIGWFDFPNTSLTGTLNVNISIYCNNDDGAGDDWADVIVDYTGSGAGTDVGDVAQHTGWQYDTIDLGSHSVSEVNNLRVRFTYQNAPPNDDVRIDHVRIGVKTSDNYELDLEVQWTNADYDEPTEYLCIYGGSMGAENITVDAWNGSGWENLFTDLNSGWNNVSVTSYLTTSNFTIRFKGGNETGDTTQHTWNIDATLLHVWTGPGAVLEDFNYVLSMAENSGSNWKVRLKAYDQSNLARLNNLTIYIYNGSNSTQITILNGAYDQQTGPWYDLNASDTEYIWMHVETSSAGTSYIYTYLEILVPNKTVYAQYIITFKIT